MKIRNLNLLFVCCIAAFCANAQSEILRPEIRIVKINCPDSLGFLTNLGGSSRACEFYFHKNEETPDMFYVENLRHKDFHDIIFNKDISKISRVKLVREAYTSSVHDFIYCINKDDQLLYYYILKDRQEEKQLVP